MKAVVETARAIDVNEQMEDLLIAHCLLSKCHRPIIARFYRRIKFYRRIARFYRRSKSKNPDTKEKSAGLGRSEVGIMEDFLPRKKFLNIMKNDRRL